MISFKDRLKMFDPKFKQKNQNAVETEQKKENIKKLSEKARIFEQGQKAKETTKNQNIPGKLNNTINKEPKINSNKLLPKSKYISEENGLSIYQYPIITFNEVENFHCKNILILGNNQTPFINNFINYCSDVSFDDLFRYKSQSIKDNNIKPFSIYNIKTIEKKCFRIICFPEFNLKNDTYKSQQTFTSLIKIFKNVTSKIDYILFLCDDNMADLEKYEKISLFILFNLFKEEIKKNFLFLYNSESEKNEVNDINKEKIINYILNDANANENENESVFNKQFNFLKNCEFINMNNQIIFEKKENLKNEWEILMNNNKTIINKINSSVKENTLEKKMILMDGIFFFDGTKTKRIHQEISKYSKEEQIYWTTFLIDIKKILKKDISPILLGIYNALYNNRGEELNIKDENISFVNVENIYITIELFSNINFQNIKNIVFQNCRIDSRYLNILGNIFTNNLISLNLSQNQISEINLFNNKDFPNLINLDLSSNNISDISPLFNSKINNLKKLNLSHNEINDLKDIEKATFKSIEYLELSYNKIIDINYLEKAKMENIHEINLSFNEIKDSDILSNLSLTKINKLDLSNNRIEKMEINKLLENLGYDCKNLIIDIKKDDLDENKNNILFDYSNKKIIKFNYLIEIEKFKEFLQNLSFGSIQNLTLSGDFSQILQNESLKELKSLDLKNNNLEDLSIFDNIHFCDIDSINLGLNKFKKGFHSLNVFKTIKTKNIEIIKNDSNSYDCSLEIENPKINLQIISDNWEFLNDNIINGVEKILISNCNITNLEYLNSPNFESLKKIELKNNYIDNIEKVFSILHSYSKINNSNEIISIENKCNPNLINNLCEDYFEMESIINSNESEKNLIEIKYKSPIEFTVLIDYTKLNDITSFKSCKKINIQNTDLDNINFLENKNLDSIREITLDNNKIENINLLNNIISPELNISIKNNQINQGLLEIDNILNSKNQKISEIVVKLDENNKKYKISLSYYKVVFDYFIDANNALDILREINLENIYDLNLSNIDLKNIDFLSNKSLKNLKKLNLDNNNIEDISIFKVENISFNNLEKLNIENNHIIKGIEVLENEFFTKCLYMIIDVNSYENEDHKISINFGKPDYFIDIFINDINDIKSIVDNFKNFKIILNEELENIEGNFISSEEQALNEYIINY